jgi:aspartate 1-decarboxylase
MEIKAGDVFWYSYVAPLSWVGATGMSKRFAELVKVQVIKVWWDKEAYTIPQQVYTCKRMRGFSIVAGSTAKKIRVGEKVIVDDVADLTENLQSAKFKIIKQIFTRLSK